jgi:small-conductance mechanosensitive channel
MRTLVVLLGLWLAAAAPVLAQPAAEAAKEAGARQSAEEAEALVRLLENDEARGRLIARLRAGAKQEQPAAQPAAANDGTLASQLAQYTRAAAQGVAGVLGATMDLADRIGAVLTGTASIDVPSVTRAVLDVAFVIAATFGMLLLLRLAFRIPQRTLARAAEKGGILRRTGLVGLAAMVDACSVLVAWGAGYAFALALAERGQLGINQTLFLNAFLLVELVKVLARTLLAPRWAALRIGRFDDTAAAYWYFWLSRLVSVVGYTMMFLAAIVAASVSADAAEAVRVIVMFAALAMASVIILQNRDAVRLQLKRRMRAGRTDMLGRSLATLGGVWHIVAIGYLVLVFVLWLANRDSALPFVLAATAQSLVAIGIGVLLVALVGRLTSGGMRLPEDVKQRLPLLEQRLNAFVPNVLRVVRAVVTVGVVLAIAQAWRVVNFAGWLSSEAGQRVAASLVSALLIVLVGWLIYLAVQSWIEYRLNPHYGHIPTARERTLLSLFRSAFTVVLSVLLAMLVLSQLGVNIGPLLAGAGVVGLAVGFGAQKLVQDVITGAFIQFENAMNEGDTVTVAGVTGVVERLTIRSVTLRTREGAYHLVPFSAVDSVSNFTKGSSPRPLPLEPQAARLAGPA